MLFSCKTYFRYSILKSMNKTLVYACLIFCVAFMSSKCGKDDTPNTQTTHCDSSNTAYIPADARSRFFFKEGTWWVYKNVTNNDYDTLTLTVESYGINPVPKKIYGDGFSKCYEGYVYNIISKLYGKVNITLSVNLPTRGNNTKGEIFVTRELFTSKDYITASLPRFRWIGEILDTVSDGNINKITSLLINNKVYNDILHYYYKPGFEPTDYLKEGWYANRIGLVKIIRKDNTIWELINCKIIK